MLLDYAIGAALISVGSYLIVMNYIRQFHNYRYRKTGTGQWSSAVPFFGPLFVIVGYSSLPVEFSNWIFLVMVLDPDTVLIVLSLPHVFRGFRS